MSKHIITEEIFAISRPTDCTKCVLTNIFEQEFPNFKFNIVPGSITTSYGHWFHGIVSGYFALTEAQTKIAISFDGGKNVVGEVVEITDEQHNIINNFLTQLWDIMPATNKHILLPLGQKPHEI